MSIPPASSEATAAVPAAGTVKLPVDLEKGGLRASLWVLVGFSAGHILRLCLLEVGLYVWR
jgi:hypothetical protein